MRYATTFVMAGCAEAAAHWLGLGYGFMVLVLAFIWTATRMTASMAVSSTASVQAKAAHQRLDVLVPKVGAVETIANNAQTTAGNALPKSGGHITGGLTVDGDHTLGGNLIPAGGTLTVQGNHHVASQLTADSTITGHGGINADGNIHANGTMAANNFSGSYFGGQPGVTPVSGSFTLGDVGSAVNGCISRLNSSGLI